MAGQEGFEPPTSGFGDRRSSRSSYWPGRRDLLRGRTRTPSLRLFVQRVRPAPAAELLELQLLRGLLAVLGGDVVPPLALAALKRDQVAHYCWISVTVPEIQRSEEHTSELQSQSNLVCRLLL